MQQQIHTKTIELTASGIADTLAYLEEACSVYDIHVISSTVIVYETQFRWINACEQISSRSAKGFAIWEQELVQIDGLRKQVLLVGEERSRAGCEGIVLLILIGKTDILAI